MVLDEKRKRELENKYKNMETDDLIRIACANEDEYDPEAIIIAKAELKMRNIDDNRIVEVSESQKKEEKVKQEKIEKTPLSKRTKFFLTIFPGLAYWYYLFRIIAPESKYKYIQKEKDALFCLCKSLAFYLVLVGIIRLLHILSLGNMIIYTGTIIVLLVVLYKLS